MAKPFRRISVVSNIPVYNNYRVGAKEQKNKRMIHDSGKITSHQEKETRMSVLEYTAHKGRKTNFCSGPA